jgi:hypothetical protein
LVIALPVEPYFTSQMLDRRDNNAGAGAPVPQQAAPAPTAPMQQQTQAAIDPITPVDNGGFDDDIPF